MKRTIALIVISVTAAFFVIASTGCAEKASASGDTQLKIKAGPNGKNKKLNTGDIATS
jgi:hypothetical protein